MTKQRVSLGFSDALDNFNPNEWTTKEKKVIDNKITSQAAIAAGFKSREVKDTKFNEKQNIKVRRRRTGRNAQFNLKARPETIASFYAIADQQEWGLGETFEKAVMLLEREYKKNKNI